MSKRPKTTDCYDRATDLTKAVLRSAEILGISERKLAEMLGKSETTVSQMKAGDYQLDHLSKEWEIGILFVRLFKGVDTLLASDEIALRSWMHTFNRDLHAVPAEYIISLAGLINIVSYVTTCRAQI